MMERKQKIQQLLDRLDELEGKDPAKAIERLLTQEEAASRKTLRQSETGSALKILAKSLQRVQDDPRPDKLLKQLEDATKANDERFTTIDQDFAEKIDSLLEEVRSVESRGTELTKSQIQDILGRFEDSQTQYDIDKQSVSSQSAQLGAEIARLGQELPKIYAKLDAIPDHSPTLKTVTQATNEAKNTLQVVDNELKDIEKRLVARINQIQQHGGGNANRNISINSNSSTLSRYTDINLIAGSNVGISYASNPVTKNTDVTISSSGTGGGGSVVAAGQNTQIQYNDNGQFGASSTFTWNKDSSIFAIGNSTSSSVFTVNGPSSVANLMGNMGIDGIITVGNSSLASYSYVGQPIFNTTVPAVGTDNFIVGATRTGSGRAMAVTAIGNPTTATTNTNGVNAFAYLGGTTTIANTTTANGGGVRNRYVVGNLSNFNVAQMSAITAQVLLVPITGSNTGTDAHVFHAETASVPAGSSLVSHYGFRSRGGAVAGNLTNRYGFYVDDMIGGTNRWGVYQAGATDFNYFAGNVGIGASIAGAKLQVGNPGSVAGTVRLAGSTAGTIQLQPASIAGDWVMTLPSTAGTVGQYLQTDGNGITQWASVTAAGGSGITRSTSVITANTTAGSTANTDYVYFANAGMTVTLPTAIANNNQYTVKVQANTSVLVAAAIGQDIDGSATVLLDRQYTALTFNSNNSVWGVV